MEIDERINMKRTLIDIEDEMYEVISPLVEEIKYIKMDYLVKFSNYFKEKFHIKYDGYVLLIHNYDADCIPSVENIMLYFYNYDWEGVDSYCIWDRYSEDPEKFNHKYKDLDTSEYIDDDYFLELVR